MEKSHIAPSMHKNPLSLYKIAVIGLGVVVLGLGYLYYAAATELRDTKAEFTSSTELFTAQVQQLEKNVADLTEENDELSDDLRREKRKNANFSDQIEEIAGTVSVLDKLRKTDEELLKKYSKVAFLNENYLPESLTAIDKSYLGSSAKDLRILTKVEPFLADMLDDARKAGSEIRVASAYRSFGTQASLKSQYTVVYGSGANQFSADQGYSEHQLGTTVDFTTTELNGALDGFDTTAAYAWLLKNAYRYGFILSYPAGNAYYQFEPWHWRFVGVELATELHRSGKRFYDMEQRDIDAYLVNIFD